MITYPIHELPKTQQPLLTLLGQEAAQLGYTAYVVGGFVRDSVLNRQSSFLDIDIVLDADKADNDTNHSADPPGIAFAHHLQKKYGGEIITHRAFGTAKWTTNDPNAPLRADLNAITLPPEIDLVTARDEIYTEPAALPIVTPSDLNHDLRRRDITINTLAVSLAPTTWQQLHDQHNGIHDLNAGLVRVLHDQSFIDDPTRIFRAIRYERRFDFNIEPHTRNLLSSALPQIDKLSAVRIRHELDRTLGESAQPELTLKRMDQLGVLAAVHPALHITPQIEQSFVQLRTTLAQPSADALDAARKILATEPIKHLYWSLLLAPFPPESSLDIAQRVELPKETVRVAHDLHTLNQAQTWTPSQQGVAAPNCDDLSPSQVVAAIMTFDPLAVALFAADPTAARQHQLYAAQYLAKWRHITPILDGNDLRELGIPPGPQYRALLTALRSERLDGNLTDRASEIAYIHEQTNSWK